MDNRTCKEAGIPIIDYVRCGHCLNVIRLETGDMTVHVAHEAYKKLQQEHRRVCAEKK